MDNTSIVDATYNHFGSPVSSGQMEDALPATEQAHMIAAPEVR
ncbi:hypothetical protein KSC_107130 [Ktedonobacter sp. SOSP1-52]|nr:hypothetical protein KSC_107130 [Ktedonobacter sp. SOSP1-52]